MFLGYRLKELRKGRNMSQEELGKLLGVTKVSVSGYEKGTRVPSMEILLLILDVFNISADYILGRELSVVCEEDDNLSLTLASDDIDIIRELRCRPSLYNTVVADPKRFFSSIYKKNI